MSISIELQCKLAHKEFYPARVGGLRLQLPELEEEDQKVQTIRVQDLIDGWEENADRVLCHHGLPYIPEIVRTELISRHHNKLLTDNFGIEKTRELITRKYYRLTLNHNVETFVTGCDIYLTLKAVRYKLYGDFQLLPVSTKNLSIDFITRLSVSTN